MTRLQNLGLRVLCLLLSVVCAAALVLPAAASGIDVSSVSMPDAGFTYTAAVYSYASSSASVIGRMEDGTAVHVLGQSGGFYKVDCYDMNGYLPKEQVKCRDGVYTVSCDVTRKDTDVLRYETLTDALLLRHSILRLAQKQIGTPYVYGGSSPRGFDCSGFSSYIYRMHDIALTRRASTQLGDGIIVSKDGLQVGDLVFFRYSGESCPASHVGIYVGDGQMLHAGNRGITYASIEDGYFGDTYLCARRVINTDTAASETLTSAASESLLPRTRSLGLRTSG